VSIERKSAPLIASRSWQHMIPHVDLGRGVRARHIQVSMEQATTFDLYAKAGNVLEAMKADRYEALRSKQVRMHAPEFLWAPATMDCAMGLAPGGRMKQEIYDDPYGLDAWDQRNGSRCFVTLLNSTQWMAVSGEWPPTEPPTAQDYAAQDLPWFDYYDADARAVAGSDRLRELLSVTQQAKATGKAPLPDSATVPTPHVIRLGKQRQVRESAGERA